MSISAGRSSDASAEKALGDGRDPGPAKPVRAGLPPRGFRLPRATHLGPVTLQIADLERSLAYYQEVLGLQLLGRDGSVASLGTPTGAPGLGAATRRPESPEDVLLSARDRRP